MAEQQEPRGDVSKGMHEMMIQPCSALTVGVAGSPIEAYPVDDILLSSVDNTDPAMFEPDAGAIKNVARTCARVHDVQLCQHTCIRPSYTRLITLQMAKKYLGIQR